MNEFKASVTKIDNLDNLNIVEFKFHNIKLYMMSLELNDLKENMEVLLTVKATHIAIAKDFIGQISLSNLIESKIIKLDIGKLLTSIKLQYKDTIFTSIITTNSALKMNLKENDIVKAIFKSSELSIKKVIHNA